MSDAHTEFLQDPEAHASHLAGCAECRALLAQLDAAIAAEPLSGDRMPLAPWEGAAYKSWGFVAAVSIVVAAIAIALCHAAGLSPIHAVAEDVSIMQWRSAIGLLTGALQRTSLGWQIVFGAAFVVVNTLLVLLLRRPPRGIDA